MFFTHKSCFRVCPCLCKTFCCNLLTRAWLTPNNVLLPTWIIACRIRLLLFTQYHRPKKWAILSGFWLFKNRMTALPNDVKSFMTDKSARQKSHINIAPQCADNKKKASHGKHVACQYSCYKDFDPR